jgi:type I restriction enzyme, S subunit
MTEGLKPYPAYKDSGVPWLGGVPEHWAVKRNKLFMHEVNERSEDGSEELLTVSQYTGITRRREGLSDQGDLLTNAASLVGYKRVKPGDLVMNIMLAWNGSLGVSSVDGIASPAYCVFRAKDGVDPRFLHYLLRTPLFTGAFKTVSTGVVDSRLRLYPDAFFRLPSPLPPLPEQSAIVRFLDYNDRRIRRYIRAKQKLIKLLEEQKQAIIHRAVTRGLNPNVGLKPSDVEWLGDVPEHWEVKRLKWVTRLQRGYDLPAERRIAGPFPVVSSGGIIDRHCEARSKGPGVVMGRYGSTDAVFYLATDFWPHNTALFVTDFQANRPRWCYFMLRTISKADHSGKSAVPGVDRKDLFDIYVAVPPVSEQDAILAWIEHSLADLDHATDAAHREIDLLREYRTRLIADVVTGKLDVREAAARLPEEAEEPEPLEDADSVAEENEEGEGATLDTTTEEAKA